MVDINKIALQILANIYLYDFILYTYNKNKDEDTYLINTFYLVNRRHSKSRILLMLCIGKGEKRFEKETCCNNIVAIGFIHVSVCIVFPKTFDRAHGFLFC